MATLRARAVSGLAYLVQRAEAMEPFHAGNFKLKLQEFVDFFERDDVVGVLAQVLRRRLPRSAESWFADAHRDERGPPLPQDPAAAMALRFALLKRVRQDKVDLRHLVSLAYPGQHLNERLMHWKRLVVHPFVADCRTLARTLGATLPAEEWVELEPALEAYLDGAFAGEAFGPRAWDDEDDRRAEEEAAAGAARPSVPAPAPASPPVPAAPAAPDPELATGPGRAERALQRLEACLPAGDEDARLDLTALRLELRRQVLAPARIAARLETLAARTGLREAAAEVLRALPPG